MLVNEYASGIIHMLLLLGIYMYSRYVVTKATINLNTIASLAQKLFVDHDGVFLDNHCVTDILPGDCVTIRTNKGDFSARKVIITAGGWAPKLLKKLGVDLPLKVFDNGNYVHAVGLDVSRNLPYCM